MLYVSETMILWTFFTLVYFAFIDFIPRLAADLIGFIRQPKPVELCSYALRIDMFLSVSTGCQQCFISRLNHNAATYLLTTRQVELFGMNLYQINHQSSSVCFFYLDF